MKDALTFCGSIFLIYLSVLAGCYVLRSLTKAEQQRTYRRNSWNKSLQLQTSICTGSCRLRNELPWNIKNVVRSVYRIKSSSMRLREIFFGLRLHPTVVLEVIHETGMYGSSPGSSLPAGCLLASQNYASLQKQDGNQRSIPFVRCRGKDRRINREDQSRPLNVPGSPFGPPEGRKY